MEELPKAYDASKVESDIYQMWLDSGYFNPDNLPDAKKRKPYTIIMPPPNANAPLHVGHALGMTIEDILIRYHRMQGKRALWLPGTDHAGFETQVVFEKKLEKEDRSRFKMTREEFYKECWDFVQGNKHITEEGIRRLGASCDWDRNIFTLDSEVVKIVYNTFQQMYADGLVYRAGRICNWCPKHQTALSDLETKYEERQEPFYYFKYGPFTIGTSRPETKFGDKYVVMHPQDRRYAKYKDGQKLEVEWVNGTITATVIKDAAVDMEFGTGVMTITPAHDATDFDIAQRHKLDIKQVIDKRGKLLPIADEFAGLKILEARTKIVERLKEKGLLEKIDEKYKHNVQLCYKCGNLIEPQIVPQWYIAMTKPLPDGRPSLRDMVLEALERKEVEIVTERFEKTFRHWMENIRDWPISRQIWWGIPIPVWYKKLEKPIEIMYFVHGTTLDNETQKSSGHYDVELSAVGKQQNESLREDVKAESFDIVFCSDLKRAKETAEVVFGGKLKIISDKRLREIDYGDLNRGDEKKVNALKIKSISKGFPNGENYKDVEKRVREFLIELADKYQGKRIAIVSHQGPQLALEVLLKDLRWEQVFEQDWRHTKAWQAGWRYTLAELVEVGGDVPQGMGWVQDPDTFDTWFSSGQWPYAAIMAHNKKMGFHETIVPELLEKNKTRTYRLRDHGLKIGDRVHFENSGRLEIFGYGIITGIKKLTVGEIELPDFIHSGKYKTTQELIAAFERMNPEKKVTKDIPAWIYDFEFHKDPTVASDFDTYFPTQVMETGWDILFFWVARMIMLSYYRTNKPPFKQVYLHGLVRDKDRQKMSKSKGNVIDPLGVIDTYGTDALRFALIFSTAAGNDIPLSEDKIRGMKYFANKLWNIARFVMTNTQASDSKFSIETDADKIILKKLEDTVKNTTQLLESYQLHEAAQTIYQFTWHELADIYLEKSKEQLKDEKTAENTSKILLYQLITTLKLLHPFMPFITEHIWQLLHERKLVQDDLLMIAEWPKLN